MPWIRANDHVTRDPGRTVIGGASFAGLTGAGDRAEACGVSISPLRSSAQIPRTSNPNV
jgi:hypothetical protein